MNAITNSDVHCVALVKGSERYVFLYDAAGRAGILRTLGRYVADPELSFTEYDAVVVCQKIRGHMMGSAGGPGQTGEAA